MKPTNAQLKKFWRWCGFKHIGIDELGVFGQFPNHGVRLDLHLNLDNLFEYAVPKLGECEIDFVLIGTLYHCIIGVDKPNDKCKAYDYFSHDAAKALFWTIWKVINEA